MIITLALQRLVQYTVGAMVATVAFKFLTPLFGVIVTFTIGCAYAHISSMLLVDMVTGK